MTKRHIEDLLPLWIEGDLGEREDAEVREHLASCEACRERAEALRKSQAWLKDAPSAPFTLEERAAFRRDVMDAIRAEASATKRRRSWRQPVLLVAAALLVAALLPLLRRSPSPEPNTQASTRPVEPILQPATPVGQAHSSSRTIRVARRHTPAARPAPNIEAGPSRIELQTSNPNIRIIWLARAQAQPSISDESTNSI
jgi:hypothetical protein